jgi:protein-S-isoprenylcysteine O-methyltransferase Ste14
MRSAAPSAPIAAAVMWRVRDEEALLASEFGDEYEQFRARTARFIPYV